MYIYICIYIYTYIHTVVLQIHSEKGFGPQTKQQLQIQPQKVFGAVCKLSEYIISVDHHQSHVQQKHVSHFISMNPKCSSRLTVN